MSMPEFVPLNSNIRYAVGIDFGHGECSAAVCEIGWGRPSRTLDDPEDILLYGNDRYTIPSAYSVSEDDIMLIGHSAIDSIKDARHFKISFKKKPSEMNESEALLYSKYLGLVHNHIRTRSTYLVQGNYVVYLSCPSGWAEIDRNLFNEMAVRSSIPVACIWAESRAGMFSNMENQTEETRELMRQGCILADIGSSTIDFSYLNSSLKTPIMDYGIQDGAQILDMILYYYILSLPGNEQAKQLVEEEGMEWLKDVLVYTCRAAKEKFFSSEATCSFSCKFDFSEIFFGDPARSTAKFRCNKTHKEIMDLFAGGLSSVGLSTQPDEHFAVVDWDAVNNGYFPVFSERLHNFVKEKVKDNPVKVMLLSGGASYMFTGEYGKSLFRECVLSKSFPDMDVAIAFDGRPSTSVSRGICSLGRAYARYLGCESNDNTEIYESMKTKIENTLDYHIKVMRATGLAQNATEKGNLFGMTNDLSTAVSQCVLPSCIPFSESARYYINAFLNTEVTVYKKDAIGQNLQRAANTDIPMPATINNMLAQEYESFLMNNIAGSCPSRQIIAHAIAEMAMPIAGDYINSFSGETLQELRDGLANKINEKYPLISAMAISSAKKIIKENLEIERAYVSELISLYTAGLQKDFLSDNGNINEGIQLPSVDDLLEQVDFYSALDTIATVVLSLIMLIVSVVVGTVLFGIPYIVSYLAFGIKEKNWSVEDWADWYSDTFMHVDFSKIKLFRVGRAAIRKMFELNYGKNKLKMESNICKTLESKEFDKSIIDTFSVVAKLSKDKYLEVVNNIFK